jgi:hypothetical protein
MNTASQTFNLISSGNVEGTNVYDPSANKIGEIDHLMIDKVSGNVRYALISFGGFMGLGHKHYPRRGGYVTNVTESQLKDAPEFSDDSWQDRDWEMRWHQHFQTTPYWDERSSARQTTNPNVTDMR